MPAKKWSHKLKLRQRLYRKGKLKVDFRIAMGRALSKKTPKGIAEADIATFSCPDCGENLRENLIRTRPEFYDCRTCGGSFIKEETFDEWDNEIAEGLG